MRQEKQLLLDEVKDQIQKFGSFVIMRYSGLSANTINNFRNEVAKIGGNVEIVRKRILLKAAENAGIKLDMDLPGHIGLVFAGNDPLETAKVVFKYSQENAKSLLKVMGGRFEGQLYSAADVEKLSKLPSKDEMRAQFLGTLEAPMAQTLAVMEALLVSMPHLLENKSKQGA